jgi:hypothetical protein
MAWDMPYDVNEPVPLAAAKRRRVSPLTWTAGALLIVGLVAGTVLSVVPDGVVSGAASATSASAEPEPSATPTPSKKPKAISATPVPEMTLRYPSCNEVWAGGQGPFKEGEPGYAKQLDPDGDGIACESMPKSPAWLRHRASE